MPNQNGPKWSEMVTEMIQMRPGIPTPNSLTKNGELLMKNWEKLPKMAQNGLAKIFPNILYFKQFLFYVKTKISLSKWPKLIGQNCFCFY